MKENFQVDTVNCKVVFHDDEVVVESKYAREAKVNRSGNHVYVNGRNWSVRFTEIAPGKADKWVRRQNAKAYLDTTSVVVEDGKVSMKIVPIE